MNPVGSFLRAAGHFMTGRLRFPRRHTGKTLVMDDGRRFRVFRHAILIPKGEPAPPQALFQVRFHLTRMSPRANKVFSWLPVPFFTGLAGFRAKFWALEEESGAFQGLYAWQTLADAQAYANSFALRFMARRAAPKSLSYEIRTGDENSARRLAQLLDVAEIRK